MPDSNIRQLPFRLPFLPAKYGIQPGRMSLPTLGSPGRPTSRHHQWLELSVKGIVFPALEAQILALLCKDSHGPIDDVVEIVDVYAIASVTAEGGSLVTDGP
jgi:hypothetical protein